MKSLLNALKTHIQKTDVTKPKLFLIAGHHDKDPGAVFNGIKESDLTIKLRDDIANELKLNNFNNIIKDPDNYNLSQTITFIRSRCNVNDIVLDLHFNAAGVLASGTEAFIKASNPTMIETSLSTELVNAVSKVLQIRNRGVKADNQSQHSRLGILYNNANTVLLEVCFITNLEKDMKMFNQNYSLVVKSIANILLKYL